MLEKHFSERASLPRRAAQGTIVAGLNHGGHRATRKGVFYADKNDEVWYRAKILFRERNSTISRVELYSGKYLAIERGSLTVEANLTRGKINFTNQRDSDVKSASISVLKGKHILYTQGTADRLAEFDIPKFTEQNAHNYHLHEQFRYIWNNYTSAWKAEFSFKITSDYNGLNFRENPVSPSGKAPLSEMVNGEWKEHVAPLFNVLLPESNKANFDIYNLGFIMKGLM